MYVDVLSLQLVMGVCSITHLDTCQFAYIRYHLDCSLVLVSNLSVDHEGTIFFV